MKSDEIITIHYLESAGYACICSWFLLNLIVLLKVLIWGVPRIAAKELRDTMYLSAPGAAQQALEGSTHRFVTTSWHGCLEKGSP